MKFQKRQLLYSILEVWEVNHQFCYKIEKSEDLTKIWIIRKNPVKSGKIRNTDRGWNAGKNIIPYLWGKPIILWRNKVKTGKIWRFRKIRKKSGNMMKFWIRKVTHHTLEVKHLFCEEIWSKPLTSEDLRSAIKEINK